MTITVDPKALGFAVKPLEWRKIGASDAMAGLDGLGRSEYTLMYATGEGGWRVYGIEGNSDGAATFPTDLIAMSAAQADYDKRIMSALVPHPTPSGDSQASLPVVTAGPFSELSGGPLADRGKSADHLDRPIGYVTPAAMELMRDGNSASGYHLVFRTPHAASQPKQQSADVPIYAAIPAHQRREEIIEAAAQALEARAAAQSEFQKSAYGRGDDIGGHGHWKAQCELLSAASAIRDLKEE